jgi:hypothetical protein
LLKTLNEPPKKIYDRLKPPLEIGLPFLPTKMKSGYFKWPLLTEIFPVSFPGVKTSRDEFLVDVEKEELVKRLEKYFDPEIGHEEMRRLFPSVMEKSVQFKPELVRDQLRKRGVLKKNIIRFCYRPFDVRWLYWEPETNLLDRGRPDFLLQVFEGNIWIVTQQKPRREWSEPQIIRSLGCIDLMDRSASCFPLLLKPNPDPSSLFDRGDDKPKANLTDSAKGFLADLRLGNKPEELFYHTLAVLHSPEYRNENGGALRQDWPRVPLPKSREALLASAELGRQVAALLDTETLVEGVTKGKPRPELKPIAELNYSGAANFKITAGWGHAGQNGVTMPGKGKRETRGYTAEETGASSLRLDQSGHSPDATPSLLGHATHDIFLNESACWRNVPEKVWDYTIGGYQVMKKWLSYREFELLGRALTPDEAREVTHMARRIAALILLQPELDKNYQAVKSATTSL